MLYLVKEYHTWIIINIPRATAEIDYLYSVLESLKDGKFLSTKYQPRLVRLQATPHVVVFANSHPD